MMTVDGGVDPLSSEILLSLWLLVAHHDDDNLSLLFWEQWLTPDLLSGVCVSGNISPHPNSSHFITEPHETTILNILVRQFEKC